ncbi:MAG: type II secretion system F family protein [Planctomycetales bacterium]|nr:type II secretion system F family protein [Planctomycetales bacterium]
MPPDEINITRKGIDASVPTDAGGGHALRSAALSVDELVAVCEELASLDRAGLPLVPALRRSSRDVSRRLDRVRGQLADELARGRPLSEVAATMLAGHSRGGGVLRAALTTGLEAGRPAEALETYVRAVQELGETRSMIARASIYPIFVMLLACVLFWLLSVDGGPFSRLVATYTDMGFSPPWLLAVASDYGAVIAIGGMVCIGLLMVWLVVWWRRGAAIGPVGWGANAVFAVVPGWGAFIRRASRTCAVRMFGCLLENNVPLDICLQQSAVLCSDRRDRQWAERAAASLQAGTLPPLALADSPLIPATVVWWLSGKEPPRAIGQRIRRFSDQEFERLAQRAQLLQSVGPVLATVAVGVTAGLCYGLTIFAPLYSLLQHFAGPL